MLHTIYLQCELSSTYFLEPGEEIVLLSLQFGINLNLSSHNKAIGQVWCGHVHNEKSSRHFLHEDDGNNQIHHTKKKYYF